MDSNQITKTVCTFGIALAEEDEGQYLPLLVQLYKESLQYWNIETLYYGSSDLSMFPVEEFNLQVRRLLMELSFKLPRNNTSVNPGTHFAKHMAECLGILHEFTKQIKNL